MHKLATHYDILGLKAGASVTEIKRAYRRLALEYHPDVCSLPDARERFIEISVAYQSLLQKIEFEESLQRKKASVETETAQEVIDAWIKAERERMRASARKHASMRYYRFKKSEMYRSSAVLSRSIIFFALFLGASVIFGSVFGTWNQWQEDSELVTSTYMGAALIIFLLGFAMTAFAMNKLFERHK